MSNQITPEQIAQFRQAQKLKAELSLALISQKQKEKLIRQAHELLAEGQDKNLILRTLTQQENLTTEEIRALEAILLTVIENTQIKREDQIKFHSEAHKKNYQLAMEAQSDKNQPKDSKVMMEQIQKKTKD